MKMNAAFPVPSGGGKLPCMDPINIIENWYSRDENAFEILVKHGTLVAEKALEVAERLQEHEPDVQFIEEAAMLHDIGMFQTDAPEIGCFGSLPYICHGIAGRDLLMQIGFERHALVCERHVWLGIGKKEIVRRKLPLPARDMFPLSIEEQIICYADKFFSKSGKNAGKRKTIQEIIDEFVPYGERKVNAFLKWVEKFE